MVIKHLHVCFQVNAHGKFITLNTLVQYDCSQKESIFGTRTHSLCMAHYFEGCQLGKCLEVNKGEASVQCWVKALE